MFQPKKITLKKPIGLVGQILSILSSLYSCITKLLLSEVFSQILEVFDFRQNFLPLPVAAPGLRSKVLKSYHCLLCKYCGEYIQ